MAQPIAAQQEERAGSPEHLPGDARHAPLPDPADAAAALGPAVAPHVVLRIALSPATHAKLLRAQRLLSHALPGGDVAAVLDRALDALIQRVERRKFAAARKPSEPREPQELREPREPRPVRALGPRTIPAAVRRAVVARDGERCAFVAPGGRRCSARSRLEFDHLDPVARGGLAHADRVRLLCRAHNQFEAERVFGRDFMQRKRMERLERVGRAMARNFGEAASISQEMSTISAAEPDRSG